MCRKVEKAGILIFKLTEALFYAWGVANLAFGMFGLRIAFISAETHPTPAWRSLAIFWPLLEMAMGVLYLLWGVGMHRRWLPTPWLAILTVAGQHLLSQWYWETFRIAGVSRWLGWFPVLLMAILMLYVAFLMRRLPSLQAERT